MTVAHACRSFAYMEEKYFCVYFFRRNSDDDRVVGYSA